jgi:hypothetical protein
LNTTINKFLLERQINQLEQKLYVYKSSPKVLNGLNEYIVFNTIVMECREIRKCRYNKHDLKRIKRKVDLLRKDPEIKRAIAIHNELASKRLELESTESKMFEEVYKFLLIKQI